MRDFGLLLLVLLLIFATLFLRALWVFTFPALAEAPLWAKLLMLR